MIYTVLEELNKGQFYKHVATSDISNFPIFPLFCRIFLGNFICPHFFGKIVPLLL